MMCQVSDVFDIHAKKSLNFLKKYFKFFFWVMYLQGQPTRGNLLELFFYHFHANLYYHPQTKLREGDVLTGVCPSVIPSIPGRRGVPLPMMNSDMGPTIFSANVFCSEKNKITVRTPDTRPIPLTPDMGFTPRSPSPGYHTWNLLLVVATKICTVGERVVSFLLECILVLLNC